MRLTVLMPCAVLVLFGCQGDKPKNLFNVYISDVSTPYIEDLGYEIFEDPPSNHKKFPEDSGLAKGDRVWEMKSVERSTIECDILGDLKRLFGSQDPDAKFTKVMIMTWHTYAVISSENNSYGISINFLEKMIKFETLMPVDKHVDVLKSEPSSNGSVVISIKYLQRNYPCIYNVLNEHYKSAVVEIEERRYQFSQ